MTAAQPEVSAPGPTADVIQLMLQANRNGMPNSARPTSAHASDSKMLGSVTKDQKLRPYARMVLKLSPRPARRNTSAIAPARMLRLHPRLSPASSGSCPGGGGVERMSTPTSIMPSAFGAPMRSHISPV